MLKVSQLWCWSLGATKMQKDFFSTKLPQEVFSLFGLFSPVSREKISLEQSFNRVLAEDLMAPQDLPGFPRATMDGYAVVSKDTFAASEAFPVWLKVVGEVRMGEIPKYDLQRGEAIKISTGGMLPQGADAVVMVEHTQIVDQDTIEVFKPVAPLQNIVLADEDFAKGELILPQGHRLRPQDIGILAAFGKQEVLVYKRPKVALISTGDEVIPIEQHPLPGQVRDINSYTLSALVEESGGVPLRMGIIKDDPKQLRTFCHEALDKADVVLISGGSSVGMRDFTLEVIRSLSGSEVLFHGIAVSPGKPTLLGKVGHKAIWGLPGQVTSAIVVFLIFVKKFIKWVGGERNFPLQEFRIVKAKMRINVPSVQGREDYLRVRVYREGDTFWAEPVFGKSGLINSLIRADGLVKIDLGKEGLYKDEEVEVILF